VNKTFFFVKSPDWIGASSSYEKAGLSFKAGKLYEEAQLVFIKASNAYINCELKFNAAKCLEEAASCALKLSKLEEASDLYAQAGNLYRDEEGFGKAATAFALAAEAMETINEEKAYNYYKEAIEIYKLDDRDRQAGDIYRSAFTFLARSRRIDDLYELMSDMIELYISIERTNDLVKLYLTTIVLDLYRDDVVLATKHFNEYMQNEDFLQSEECDQGRYIISAFEQRSVEILEKCKKSKIFSFLHNEIVSIVKSLKIDDDDDGRDIL